VWEGRIALRVAMHMPMLSEALDMLSAYTQVRERGRKGGEGGWVCV
jgi:hypothetical protein